MIRHDKKYEYSRYCQLVKLCSVAGSAYVFAPPQGPLRAAFPPLQAALGASLAFEGPRRLDLYLQTAYISLSLSLPSLVELLAKDELPCRNTMSSKPSRPNLKSSMLLHKRQHGRREHQGGRSGTAFQWQRGGSASKMRCENGWQSNNPCPSTRSRGAHAKGREGQ